MARNIFREQRTEDSSVPFPYCPTVFESFCQMLIFLCQQGYYRKYRNYLQNSADNILTNGWESDKNIRGNWRR